MPPAPGDIPPTSVSAAALPLAKVGTPPLARLRAAAALTTFEGQAVFRRMPGRIAPLRDHSLFRLAPGSRTLTMDTDR